MKQYQTKNQQQQESNLPTQLDVLQIIDQRTRGTFADKYFLTRLEAGAIGEETVLDSIQKYGKSHWIVIRNLWLNYNGTFESDLVLITTNSISTIEIKNYDGIFEYEDGNSTLNGKLLPSNCIAQANRAYINIANIIREISTTAKVNGSIVFIGEHNQVDIRSNIPNIHVIRRNQLRNFIQTIAREESQDPQSIDPTKIITHLEKYETTNPFTPDPITPHEMTQLRKGIYCAHCHSFNVKISRLYVKCRCGKVELREESMVRTICEYGVLNYDKGITRSGVSEFLNGQASKRYLLKILKKHFKVVRKNRYTHYLSKN